MIDLGGVRRVVEDAAGVVLHQLTVYRYEGFEWKSMDYGYSLALRL